MFFYVILFLIIGFITGFIVKNNAFAVMIICTISIIWILIWGIWAVATFIELIAGYAIARAIVKSEESS